MYLSLAYISNRKIMLYKVYNGKAVFFILIVLITPPSAELFLLAHSISDAESSEEYALKSCFRLCTIVLQSKFNISIVFEHL